jgi:F-type H+-transporting ATPase subunit a
VNATIAFTWAVMLLMAGGSWLLTRHLVTGAVIPRGQNALEVVVDGIRRQVREIAGDATDDVLPFVASLFLFIAVSNALTILPGYVPPTSSLSTTAALAGCVFVAVPAYGVAREGWRHYLRSYVEPTALMLPFRVISELSRTLALAVRLFGNVMSGAKAVAILVAVAPFLFPILLQTLGLLTGLIQAYIFAVLATVYITSGIRARETPRAPGGGSDATGRLHGGAEPSTDPNDRKGRTWNPSPS